jgi:PBP1b-binding outer membrane lipoprotein LpoB
MRKKISQILFVIILTLLATSCKNTKQKLQEYVVSYNKTAVNFKSKNVTLTTARGYINDNKIELRFETDLEQNEVNKTKAVTGFPKMLKEMIIKNEEFATLVEEGVQFDTYFLAKDNTVLEKRIINKEEMAVLLK